MENSYAVISALLDKLIETNEAWHTRKTKVDGEGPSKIVFSRETIKMDEERDETMAKLVTQMGLLTKHVLGGGSKTINVVGSCEGDSMDEQFFQKSDDGKFLKFIERLKGLSISIPLVEALEQMPGYAKIVKDLVTKRRNARFEMVGVTHLCTSIVTKALVQKKEYPGAFTIPCTIGVYKFAKALCDLGASINLIPLAMFNKLGLGSPRPTTMRLLMADRTVKKPVGILYDVLERVDRFIFLIDFVILDCEVDFEVPIILGKPFLATGHALVDVERGDLKFRINDEEVVFHICKSMKQLTDISIVSVIDTIDKAMDITVEHEHVGDMLAAVIMNYEEEDEKEFGETVNALIGLESYHYNPKKLDLDLEHRATPPAKPFIIELPTLKLKPLPSHLRYEFLVPNNMLPKIISARLMDE
ncbi:uncharacterized protein LOC132608274 [Lycium barbarum]|uniref:uncharacterized protein LOC132608274 n=1 Tax=Lycium barbarum TaxID=112863 RepID=UPI00293F4B18|nr:uncharacterized protein LOC132608274 [Lycium barbarum]